MSPSLVLAAVLCGQAPSPQHPAAAVPAAGPPQTLVLLQYAAPATPAAPSVLVANPPLWDRAAAGLGHWLVQRAAKHQHGRPAQLVTAVPVTAVVQTVAVPTPSPVAAASEQVPTPPNFQPAPTPPSPLQPGVILVPDPSGPVLPRRIFGGG